MALYNVMIAGNNVGLSDLEAIFTDFQAANLQDVEHLKDLILARVKDKNYIPVRMESTYREELYEEYLVFTGAMPSRRSTAAAVEIRLYGAACANCEKLDAMVKQILSQQGLRLDYQYLTDLREIARVGILATPALMVAGTIILAGRVPSEKDLKSMLLKAIETAKSGEA